MSVLAVSRPARRRAQIRESLPTDHPAILDQIGALIDGLPDPLDLGPDQVVGSMTATARLRNRLDAYLVAVGRHRRRGPPGTRSAGRQHRHAGRDRHRHQPGGR